MDEIAALLEPRIPALRRFAYALTRSGPAADDLVQDTLERAVGRWHLRRRDGSLDAWLYAILRNLFLASLRQRRRRGEAVGVEALDRVAAPEPAAEAVAGARDLMAALDLLPEEQRAVLLLVAVEDLSYEDAARALGVPVGTVMSRLSRARQKLRGLVGAGRPTQLKRVK
jgi:RNA polymerase sigma factor (sigma-70 family)